MPYLLPAAALALAIALHAALARRQPRGNRVPQFLAVGMIAGAGLLWGLAGQPGIHWPQGLAALAA